MAKIIHILLVYIFFVTIACNVEKTNINDKYNYIEVLFMKGYVETPISISCGRLKEPLIKKIDTVQIKKEKYNELINQIKTLKKLRIEDDDCDVRIQCKINFENGDSIQLCIGDSNCTMKDGHGMEKNDSVIYLIREYSGYYNYFSEEQLIYFDEIQQFGIPADYKDLRRKNVTTNGIPLPPPPPDSLRNIVRILPKDVN